MESGRAQQGTLSRIGRACVVTGLGAALFGVPAAFDPRLYDDFTAPKQSVLLLAAGVTLVGLALQGLPLPRRRAMWLALAAWLITSVVAWAAAWDPVAGIAGVYQYRLGIATDLCFLVLFVGALSVDARHIPLLAAAGLAGLAVVTAYTAVQAAGVDPVAWWIDTSDRTIGTIGNANELAAYGLVAVAVACLGATRRRRTALLIAGPSACLFLVVESASRSGLIGLATVAFAFPAACYAAKAAARDSARVGALAASGILAGIVVIVASGHLGGIAGRLFDESSGDASAPGTRLALWRGGLEVVLSEPVTGVGPAGLPLAFPLLRPARLEGEFEVADPVVQSTHNWLLDRASEAGLPGAAALAGLLVVVAVAALHRVRNEGPDPPVHALGLAAVAGYLVMTFLNPLSLSAHAVFWVVAGLLASGGGVRPIARPAAVTTAALPVAAVVSCLAILVVAADREASRGWDLSAAGRHEQAAARYRVAARLAPWERRYFDAEARAWLQSFVQSADPTDAGMAVARLDAIEDRFRPTWGEALDRSVAIFARRDGAAAVRRAAAEAYRLNPHGRWMRENTEALQAAARSAGGLEFDAAQERLVGLPPAPGTRIHVLCAMPTTPPTEPVAMACWAPRSWWTVGQPIPEMDYTQIPFP